MSWSPYGDYDSASWYGHWPPPSAFIQYQRMQAQAQQLGHRPPSEAEFATHAHFPGHKQGMAPYTCPPWTCTNKLCKAVNDTGKPKLLECRLCAEPRPLATTLWALEHFGGPGLATAKRMMAEGRRVKGWGKGQQAQPSALSSPPPGAQPKAKAAPPATPATPAATAKGKGKGKQAAAPPPPEPRPKDKPKLTQEFLKILEETGKGQPKAEPQDEDDVDDDDVYIEDGHQVFLAEQESLMSYIKTVEARSSSPSQQAQLKGLRDLYEQAKTEQEAKDKKLRDQADELTKEPKVTKQSTLQRKAAVVASTIADLTQQREAAEADYANQLKQKQEKVQRAKQEVETLLAAKASVVGNLDNLLDLAEQSRGVLEAQIQAHRPPAGPTPENLTEEEPGSGDEAWRAKRARWQKRSKVGVTARIKVTEENFQELAKFFNEVLGAGMSEQQAWSRFSLATQHIHVKVPPPAEPDEPDEENEASSDHERSRRDKYPHKLEKYHDKKEELRRKMKHLTAKERRARAKNAEANGIRDMGDVDNDADGGSSRSRSSFGDRSPDESVFQPSGSDV